MLSIRTSPKIVSSGKELRDFYQGILTFINNFVNGVHFTRSAEQIGMSPTL